MKVVFYLFLASFLLVNPAFAVKERALPWARRVVERNSELQKPSRALSASKIAVRRQKEMQKSSAISRSNPSSKSK